MNVKVKDATKDISKALSILYMLDNGGYVCHESNNPCWLFPVSSPTPTSHLISNT